MQNDMTTLTEVLNNLCITKMDTEFRWIEGGLTVGNEKIYTPDNLTIFDTYRFEGMSNPSDMSIIYMIKANDGTIGYSLDSYGVYSNHEAGYYEFIRLIPILRCK